jgi:hypothetical protein
MHIPVRCGLACVRRPAIYVLGGLSRQRRVAPLVRWVR